MSLGCFHVTFRGADVTVLLGPVVAHRLTGRRWRIGQKRNNRQRREGRARHALMADIRTGDYEASDALAVHTRYAP